MKTAQIAKPVAAKSAMSHIVAQAPVADAIAKADAAAKPARTRRPAQAATPKVNSIVAKSAAVIAVKYTIAAGRPVAGRPLRAFTQAVIELLNMTSGKAYPRATLAKIMGDTAVNYHIRKTLAFSITNDGIALTPGFGSDFFALRAEMKEFDLDHVKAFKAILTTGKPDGTFVKNPNFIKAM